MNKMGKNKELSVEELLLAFKSGAVEVMNQKDELNKINVFPVADGDTGSNLSSLMKGIYGFEYDQSLSIETSYNQLSEVTLIGARGNSGSIFAQYLCELLRQLTLQKGINATNFTFSANQAVTGAYQAIDNPQEGTMLTVIRTWAESLKENLDQVDSFEELLKTSLEMAKRSLAKTTSQLKVLKQSDVVDAGGKGFYLFVKGFTEAVCTKEWELLKVKEPVAQLEKFYEHPNSSLEEVPEYRYCTEILLSDVILEREEIKKRLRPLGDSLIVAGTPQTTKIHIHSNQPAEVVRVLQDLGEIIEHKADDMLNQYVIKNNQKYPIALVTDSIADLPADFILEEQIQILPLNLFIADHNFLDKVTITSNDLWEYPQEVKMSSAQPSIKAVENMFDFLSSYYKQIIVISVASKLSGTYSLLQKISQKYQDKETEIAVIDSYQNSAAQGLLVFQAAEWIRHGKSFEAIVELITNGRSKAQIFVSVPELTAMIKSGRLSGRVGKIAQWVNLKPLVTLDPEGGGKIAGVAFNLAKNEDLLRKKIKQKNQQHPIIKYAVVHAGAVERAEQMAEAVEQILGYQATYIMDISSVVAMSAGQGSVAVAILQEIESEVPFSE